MQCRKKSTGTGSSAVLVVEKLLSNGAFHQPAACAAGIFVACQLRCTPCSAASNASLVMRTQYAGVPRSKRLLSCLLEGECDTIRFHAKVKDIELIESEFVIIN